MTKMIVSWVRMFLLYVWVMIGVRFTDSHSIWVSLIVGGIWLAGIAALGHWVWEEA
jgi:hypothetical protein